MRINVYFTANLLDQIDTYCKANGLTRSTFLKIAALDEMGKGVYTHTAIKTKMDVKKELVEKKIVPAKEKHFSPMLNKFV
jgi:hypothetical protein